ncbi:MAG: hypothetical protein IMY86_08155 [Chloroflexi bacterium]|nr:hypothetical protein [Chloroflexota bacterium]
MKTGQPVWRELEFLPSQGICLVYKMAMWSGWNLREEGSVKDWQPTSSLGAIPADNRLFDNWAAACTRTSSRTSTTHSPLQ